MAESKAPPDPIEYVTPFVRRIIAEPEWDDLDPGRIWSSVSGRKLMAVRDEIIRLAALYAEALDIVSDLSAERGLGQYESPREAMLFKHKLLMLDYLVERACVVEAILRVPGERVTPPGEGQN